MHPSWITDSIAEGRALPLDKYLLYKDRASVRQMLIRVPSTAENDAATAAVSEEADVELLEPMDVQRVGSDVSVVSRTRSGEREGLVPFDPANPGPFIEGCG